MTQIVELSTWIEVKPTPEGYAGSIPPMFLVRAIGVNGKPYTIGSITAEDALALGFDIPDELAPVSMWLSEQDLEQIARGQVPDRLRGQAELAKEVFTLPPVEPVEPVLDLPSPPPFNPPPPTDPKQL